MAEKDNILSLKLVKKDGKLVHQDATAGILLQTVFIAGLEEGQVVNVLFEAYKDDGTNDQLAKIHVCIRKLATEIGYTFDEMKRIIKRNSGLAWTDMSKIERFRSFADCSKEELSLVIEALNEAGLMVNITFQ